MTSVEFRLHIPPTAQTSESSEKMILDQEYLTRTRIPAFKPIQVSHPNGPLGAARIQEFDSMHASLSTHPVIDLKPGEGPVRVFGASHAYIEIFHHGLDEV